MRKNYSIVERSYIFSAIKRGMTLSDLNKNLEKSMKKLGLPARPVPESTYKMIKNSYLKLSPDQIWDHIHAPKNLGHFSKGV